MSGAAVPFKAWVRKAALRVINRAPIERIEKWKVVAGDMVIVNAGRSAGATGKVTKVLRAENRLIVEGANLVKRHVKPTQTTPGGVVAKESPMHVSNVNLVDPSSG